MTVSKGKPNEPANAEVRVDEQAILCANGKIHYGSEMFQHRDAGDLLRIADLFDSRSCGPHSYATRERIVTAWTEKPL